MMKMRAKVLIQRVACQCGAGTWSVLRVISGRCHHFRLSLLNCEANVIDCCVALDFCLLLEGKFMIYSHEVKSLSQFVHLGL